MADVTINQLPAVTSPNTSLQLPVSDGTTTRRMTVSQILGLQSGVPIGTIVMWSNYNGAGIPSGWALCDGQAGRPDLRDRFVVGSGNSYSIGNTGGSNSVTLSVNQIPSHNHQVLAEGASGWGPNHNWIGGNRYWAYNPGWTTSNTGGGQSHENRPPYYAVAFIIKIS